MKSLSIFDFKDYRSFIEAYIESRPHNGHGEKSKIAQAIRCHNAYLSQILMKKADLSAEQTHDLSKYLGFSVNETDFFLLLVQFARAGKDDLRKHYLQKISKIQEEREVLRNRIQPKQSVNEQDEAKYFSAWYYAVIHLMLLTLKGYQSAPEIEKALGLDAKIVRDVILFLEETGLVQKKGNTYIAGLVDIHIRADSTMFNSYHTNWRMQAIRSFEHRTDDQLHYSSAVTVHEDDFQKIRKILIEAIDRTRECVTASKNENRLGVFTLDWFKLV